MRALSRTSPSGVDAGCTIGAPPGHGCSHRTAPVAGSTLVAPNALRNTICVTPSIVVGCGEL
jgi:hypothetical protein